MNQNPPASAVGRASSEDVAIGIGRFAKRDDELNQRDDSRDACPAEYQVEDAFYGPPGIELVDAKPAQEKRQDAIDGLVYQVGTDVGRLLVAGTVTRV